MSTPTWTTYEPEACIDSSVGASLIVFIPLWLTASMSDVLDRYLAADAHGVARGQPLELLADQPSCPPSPYSMRFTMIMVLRDVSDTGLTTFKYSVNISVALTTLRESRRQARLRPQARSTTCACK